VRLINTRTVGDEPRLSDSKARPRRIDTDASTTAGESRARLAGDDYP